MALHVSDPLPGTVSSTFLPCQLIQHHVSVSCYSEGLRAHFEMRHLISFHYCYVIMVLLTREVTCAMLVRPSLDWNLLQLWGGKGEGGSFGPV